MKIGKIGRFYIYVWWTDKPLDPEKLKLLKDGGVFVRKSPARKVTKGAASAAAEATVTTGSSIDPRD
mgnify:CR=1 FL=1